MIIHFLINYFLLISLSDFTCLCLDFKDKIGEKDGFDSTKRNLQSSTTIYDTISKPEIRPPIWHGDQPLPVVPQEAPPIPQADTSANVNSQTVIPPLVPLDIIPVIPPLVNLDITPPTSSTKSSLNEISDHEKKYNEWLKGYKTSNDDSHESFCRNFVKTL